MKKYQRLHPYARLDITADGCWLWTGAKQQGGYGRLTFERTPWGAHRWFWTQLVGPIPEGMELDHLCRVRACVRPSHLEVVTRAENIARAELLRGADHPNGRKTHCPQGHPYQGENLALWTDARGYERRICRICRIEIARRWRDLH